MQKNNHFTLKYFLQGTMQHCFVSIPGLCRVQRYTRTAEPSGDFSGRYSSNLNSYSRKQHKGRTNITRSDTYEDIERYS